MRAALLLAPLLLGLLAGCATGAPRHSPEANKLRARLEALGKDPQVGPLVPVAMVEAERAVDAADAAARRGDVAETSQRLYLANIRIEIARAQAERRRAENRMRELTRMEGPVRLEPRPPAPPPDPALQQPLKDLGAQNTPQGWKLVLGATTFASSKAELAADAKSRLTRLAAVLKQNPQRSVVIEGYTDDSGRELDNLALSQRRAEAVRAWLVEAGVAASRLASLGRGENNPVADNRTAEGRQQNRRVELLLPN